MLGGKRRSDHSRQQVLREPGPEESRPPRVQPRYARRDRRGRTPRGRGVMIAIRDITAERGEKKQGWLTIGETASGPLRIPLVLIHGREDGPTFCVTAGVHATEYAPIDAVMRLLQSLDPARLRGTVIGVPVTNMRMFEHRTGFTSPLDGLNLN